MVSALLSPGFCSYNDVMLRIGYCYRAVRVGDDAGPVSAAAVMRAPKINSCETPCESKLFDTHDKKPQHKEPISLQQ